MASPATKTCPQCGTHLAGASQVEGLCSACLLSFVLEEGQEPRAPSPVPGPRVTASPAPPRELHPVGSGIIAPNWAMPAELLRQASRRLRIAAVGVALTFSVAILINNLIEAADWYSFANAALRFVPTIRPQHNRAQGLEVDGRRDRVGVLRAAGTSWAAAMRP